MAITSGIHSNARKHSRKIYDLNETPPVHDPADNTKSLEVSRPEYITVTGMDAGTSVSIQVSVSPDESYMELVAVSGSNGPNEIVYMRKNINLVQVVVNGGPNVKVYSQD